MKIDSGLKLAAVLVVLAGIGVLRVLLEVRLGIFLDEKWFSFAPDIMFTMACYPVYLCFFLFMCLHFILRRIGICHVEDKLIGFFFRVQFVHLIIPFVDAIGFRYNIAGHMGPYLNAQGMSFGFSMDPFADMPALWSLPVYFTPLILLFTRVTTLGINVAWLLVGVMFFIFMRRQIMAGPALAMGILFLMFQIIYWPVYKYYFVFNGLFDALTGMTVLNHYGYGFYFLAAGIAGIVYFRRVTRQASPG